MRICKIGDAMDFECGESLLLLSSKEVYCASIPFHGFPSQAEKVYFFLCAICVPVRQMLLQLLSPLRQPLVLPPLQFTVRTQVLSVSLMIFY